MRKSLARRGQAIVETALAILVFVTVLMFGIHFTEITYTQMKVTEAAQSAVWQSTAGTMHVTPALLGDFTLVNGVVSAAMANTNARYADFDGAETGPGLPKQIFSTARAGSMNVQCNVGIGLNQSGAGILLTPYQWLVYRDNGGMQCTAEAWIDTGGVSKIGTFLEGANGFFNKRGDASHKQSVTQTAGYHVCGLNKAGTTNGPCRGSFSMLIDDWGMASGGSEEDTCPVYPYGIPCVAGNMAYWMSGYLVYQANSLIFGSTNGSDYRLLQTIVGTPFWPNTSIAPLNPTSFYTAMCGEDFSQVLCVSMFMEATPWHGDGSWWVWQTSPFAMWPTYGIAWGKSSGCYLGQDCGSTANSP